VLAKLRAIGHRFFIRTLYLDCQEFMVKKHGQD